MLKFAWGDFMRNKILIVLLSVLALTKGHSLYQSIFTFLEYTGTPFLENVISSAIPSIAYHACGMLLCVFAIVCILRKTNFSNSVRYTYDEYREHRKKKKAEKIDSKKQKLQKKLNEIEKD